MLFVVLCCVSCLCLCVWWSGGGALNSRHAGLGCVAFCVLGWVECVGLCCWFVLGGLLLQGWVIVLCRVVCCAGLCVFVLCCVVALRCVAWGCAGVPCLCCVCVCVLGGCVLLCCVVLRVAFGFVFVCGELLGCVVVVDCHLSRVCIYV